jgi:hypothetical protein
VYLMMRKADSTILRRGVLLISLYIENISRTMKMVRVLSSISAVGKLLGRISSTRTNDFPVAVKNTYLSMDQKRSKNRTIAELSVCEYTNLKGC